eukprot:TRINITY_DN7725_c0_g1_i4.p1 TRINITY_DN7725_c0_g1~~TRINITY_DN7725_c0_g1_i4.p1  ORF type:complete len:498 (-),score=46.67 TRINITY_DN7725_c0_g1_i4:258-1751(-)
MVFTLQYHCPKLSIVSKQKMTKQPQYRCYNRLKIKQYLTVLLRNQFQLKNRNKICRKCQRGVHYQVNCSNQEGIQTSNIRSEDQEELKEICRNILLSFYACESGYQFASQCLVETVIVAFKKGYIPEQIKGCIQLLGLQCGAQLLKPIEEDVIMQWVVIIHKTLVECYGTIKSERIQGDESQMLEGMGDFVKQTMQTWLSGTSLKQLEIQQQLARQDAIEKSGAISPTLKVMQLSARFVMLTLETVELVENLQLREITEYGNHASDLFITDFVPQVRSVVEEDERRRLAVQLLVCLIGGITGSVLSLNQFVLIAWEGYLKGYSVQQLLSAIQGYEFLQKTDLIPVGVVTSGQANPETINLDIFARWLSVVYMSWAQLGVPIANIGTQQEGWATAESQDVSEAIDLAAFVSSQLQTYDQQQEQFQERMQDPQMMEAIQHSQANIIKQGQESVLIKVEDQDLAATSTTLIVMQQLVALVKIAVAQIERVVYSETTVTTK